MRLGIAIFYLSPTLWLVPRQLTAHDERLSTLLRLVIAVLEMDRVHVHLHVRLLADRTVAVLTLPFILATVRRHNVPAERLFAVKCVGTLFAKAGTPG